MANSTFTPITGVVQSIRPFQGQCCQQMLTLQTSNGIVHFIISQTTYVIDDVRFRPGMTVSAFYDASLPVPLIYPPQYQAAFIGRRNPNDTILVDTFNRQLVSADNTLRLNIARSTDITTSNGQSFTCPLGNHLLIVFYTSSTRSIPAQTTPRRIIVMC